MAVQKLRSYTQQLMHNDMLKLDYLFLTQPVQAVVLKFQYAQKRCARNDTAPLIQTLERSVVLHP